MSHGTPVMQPNLRGQLEVTSETAKLGKELMEMSKHNEREKLLSQMRF